MSSYALFKSNGKSLKRLGQINRLLYITLSAAFPSITYIIVFSKGYLMAMLLILVSIALIATVVAWYLFNKHIKQNLQAIGTISVGKSNLVKSIGDLKEQYSYANIKQLSVKPHLRKIVRAADSNKSLTYLITLQYEDKPKEQFVIASEGNELPNPNFIDNIKWIQKYHRLQFYTEK